MEVESGHEVFIPRELSQNSFPMSFRFYDAILITIKNLMPQESNQFFRLKKAIEHTFS